MKKPNSTFFSLQRMITDLSLMERKHYLPGTKRRENDIEHSMSVALLCWYIHDKLELDLDIAKIFKYALTHDFVERYAGDTSTFASKEERAAKILREQESLVKLSVEFSSFSDMTNTMQGYENKQDEESLFVWTVDKMQALIMGDMDNWTAYAEAPISYSKFSRKFDELYPMSSKFTKEMFKDLIDYCKTTYYNQPKDKHE